MPHRMDYRKAQALRAAELMEQARNAQTIPQAAPSPAQSTVEPASDTESTQGPRQAPAHRLSEQYDKNIEALGRGAEAFARHPDNPSEKVVKSSGSNFDYPRDPDSPNRGVNLRRPPTNPKLQPSSEPEEPMHVQQPIAYEKAIDRNEEMIADLHNAPTSGAVQELSTRPDSDASTAPELPASPESPTPIEAESAEPAPEATAPSEPPFDPETTNTQFAYTDDELAFFKLAEGAVLESGQGKPVTDRNRTQTQVVVPGLTPDEPQDD